jgi:3-phosphoshikimate 1-carboxyvinyltransferase
MPELPDPLTIEPRGPLDARVRVPGSKSVTNRALLAAALAEGGSELTGALASDDTEVMIASLSALGSAVDASGEPWRVAGTGGRLRAPAAPLFVGNSGTTARFLTAAACLADGPVTIDGTARMRERPIGDLTAALAQLGAECRFPGESGFPPVIVAGGGLRGGNAAIAASRSSQYVSAVLLAAPYAQHNVALRFLRDRLVSRPYVELTIDVMRAFGAEAEWDGTDTVFVRAGVHYRSRRYAIEADASSAAYPFCAAAIAGGSVRVDGIDPATRQPDIRILDLLEQMGCEVKKGPDWAEVRAVPGRLAGIDADMNELPDAVLALAVVALFAEGRTRIRNVANLRIKETDRLAALETELGKLGARARAGADTLEIEPGPLRPAVIDTYDDHRMAMAFALAGLRQPGVAIRDPGCVSKTWPDYFAMLARL